MKDFIQKERSPFFISPTWQAGEMIQIKGYYYTYVLWSKRDHRLYIGYTSDLHRRLSEHNQGKNTSTSNRRPLELIYFEGHRSKEDAFRREGYFKTTSGKRSLRLMLRSTFEELKDKE